MPSNPKTTITSPTSPNVRATTEFKWDRCWSSVAVPGSINTKGGTWLPRSPATGAKALQRRHTRKGLPRLLGDNQRYQYLPILLLDYYFYSAFWQKMLLRLNVNFAFGIYFYLQWGVFLLVGSLEMIVNIFWIVINKLFLAHFCYCTAFLIWFSLYIRNPSRLNVFVNFAMIFISLFQNKSLKLQVNSFWIVCIQIILVHFGTFYLSPLLFPIVLKNASRLNIIVNFALVFLFSETDLL